MTLVTIRLDPAPSPGHGARIGYRRAVRSVDAVTDTVYLTTEETTPLIEGIATLEVEPGIYQITEYAPGGGRRTVIVPDVALIDYTDLVDVDPTSLNPGANPPAEWTIALGALTDRVDDLAAGTIPDEVIEAKVEAYMAANPIEGDPGFQVPFTAAASWTIPVPPGFGRTPNVGVYVGGALVLADVTASPELVTVTFPSPVAGVAVLS